MSDAESASGGSPAPETADQVVAGLLAQIEPLLALLREKTAELLDVYTSVEGALLLAIVIGSGVAARFLAPPLQALLERIWPTQAAVVGQRGLGAAQRLAMPAIWAALLWLATAALAHFGLHRELVRIAASLLNAWIVIRLFSGFVRDPLWSKTFATLAWSIAALNILRLLNPTIALLNGVGFTIGDTQVTLYMLVKGALFAFLLIWLAVVIASFVQGRVHRSQSLTPSMQTLIGQTVRIGLLFLAVMMALKLIGIDLTALAVFSGAIGIGIGFGLQAIFSNLVAGIILLFEGSVKVGDFVDLADGATGEVKEIGIRATRVTTNDNIDMLVPNSEFINNRVTNWTLREGFRRLRIPFGVACGTDKELVRKAVLEAAATVPHELKGPGARPAEVWLVNFGESSLDFELVIWLDPAAVKRPARVNADYNWAIEIPFPQRDLHIRSGMLPVKIDGPPES